MIVLDRDANKYVYNEFYKNGIDFIKYHKDLHLFSTGMYLINRKGAEKIINYFMDTTTDKFELTSRTSIIQTDFLLYMNVNTYTTTYPLCFPNVKFISEIHPLHYQYHIQAIHNIDINLKDSEYKNQYVLNYYPFEEFDKFFINYIKENNE